MASADGDNKDSSGDAKGDGSDNKDGGTGAPTGAGAPTAGARDEGADDKTPTSPDDTTDGNGIPPAPSAPVPPAPAAQPVAPLPAPPTTIPEKPAVAGAGATPGAASAPPAAKEEDTPHEGRFGFGTYGRMIAGGDVRGRPGRNADITAYGSRLDHASYVELELRREDHWDAVDADTKIVATLAIAHPVFHYNGKFDASIAVRNLYIEERDLGAKGLQIWAGSRMLRGDDIYILDFWPLDNLNTVGGGAIYDLPTDTQISLHMGLSQPANPFFQQQADRPTPLNQFGAASVAILDRQQWTGSLRAQQQIPIGEDGAGIKLVAYGELHQLPEGQRETPDPRTFETLPHESGYVIGAQLTGYTGKRSTHINLYARYASGIPAYGAFANPQGLGADGSAADAHELLLAAGGQR